MNRNRIAAAFAAVLAAFTLNVFAAVDANQASQAELETVKGIGPAMSGKIIEQRKAGAFKSWADMVDRVSGIGDGNAARFSQAGLTVAGSTYTGAPKAAKPEQSARADKPAKAAPAATAGKAAQ